MEIFLFPKWKGLQQSPKWKYSHLLHEQEFNGLQNGNILVYYMNMNSTLMCIFCDKVTKGGIYRSKQHLVGGYRNVNKHTKCLEHVREEIKDYASTQKSKNEQMNMKNQNANEDFDEEIDSRIGVTHISSGGSNRVGSFGKTMQSSLKRPRQIGLMDHFFTPHAKLSSK